MPSEIPPITFGSFYHIYNRGNNRENIFVQERNYAYFMDLWWKHTFPDVRRPDRSPQKTCVHGSVSAQEFCWAEF